MKKLFFAYLIVFQFDLTGQTKADGRFENLETIYYSGLTKASVRFRISQNNSEEWVATLRETPDTFYVQSVKLYYEDTTRVNLHKLTFNKGDTCIQDINTFLFSGNYPGETYFYTEACCENWKKTNIKNLYISKLHKKLTMHVIKRTTRPFLMITYRYYPKMTEQEHRDYLSGSITW